MPPRSWSPRNVFSVIGVAILPVRISDARDLVDAAMHLLGEVLGLEEVRHAIERVVVHKHRAEQCLLSLDVVWSRPVLRFHPASLEARQRKRRRHSNHLP